MPPTADTVCMTSTHWHRRRQTGRAWARGGAAVSGGGGAGCTAPCVAHLPRSSCGHRRRCGRRAARRAGAAPTPVGCGPRCTGGTCGRAPARSGDAYGQSRRRRRQLHAAAPGPGRSRVDPGAALGSATAAPGPACLPTPSPPPAPWSPWPIARGAPNPPRSLIHGQPCSCSTRRHHSPPPAAHVRGRRRRRRRPAAAAPSRPNDQTAPPSSRSRGDSFM